MFKYIPSKVPTPIYLKVKSWLYNLKVDNYGEKYSKSIISTKKKYFLTSKNRVKKLLIIFKKFCVQEKIDCILYSTPIWKYNKTYDKNQYERYLMIVKEISKIMKIPFYDFTTSLKSSSKYFVDYIHLRPLGNNNLAKLLYQKIEANND